jgi:hypothetical protein
MWCKKRWLGKVTAHKSDRQGFGMFPVQQSGSHCAADSGNTAVLLCPCARSAELQYFFIACITVLSSTDYEHFGDRILQELQLLRTVGTGITSVGIATLFRESNPSGGEIFRTRPDRPWDPPSLLYNGYRVFPGGKGGRSVTLTTHPLLVPWS